MLEYNLRNSCLAFKIQTNPILNIGLVDGDILTTYDRCAKLHSKISA